MADVMERANYNPWGWFLAYGIASVLMGWLVLARPVDTIISLVLLLGFYLLVFGVIRTIYSFMGIGQKGSYWGIELAVGLLMLVAGLVVLNNPLFTSVLTPVMFLYIVAFSLIVNGIVAMVAGREDYAGNRNWTWGSFILGGLYLALGLGLLGAETYIAVASVVTFAGWALVAVGVVNVVFSFMIRSEV